MDDKNSLRKKILHIRKNMTQDQVEGLSIKICNQLIDSEIYQSADSIFCYYAVRNEVDLTFLINKALEDGKKVSLPIVIDKAGFMKFYEITSLDDMEIGAYGIPQPKAVKESVSADFIIVPGVVFSKKGDRIGQAGGFYDRFLGDNDIKSIGVCYDFQLLEEIPFEEHDVKMNRIMSDKRDIFI